MKKILISGMAAFILSLYFNLKYRSLNMTVYGLYMAVHDRIWTYIRI